MAIDISKKSEKELIKLQAEIDKRLQQLAKSKKDDARKAAEAAAKKHGFSLNDLVGGTRTAKKAPAKAKYRNPENPSQTWSGRGRQPGWFKDAMKAGKSADDLAA
ncbi:MAG: H-NS histone family protein [Pseudomonadota bacterium]